MKLYNKEELKHSRIFFDKQPPKYLFVLNCFLIILLVTSIIGSHFITKNYIVKAQGTIEADDKLYVTPTINGNVVEVHKQGGEQVKKGDVLLTLSTGAEGVQEKEFQRQIDELEAKEEIYDKYEQSLKEKKNLLKNEDEEQVYYGKVAYYLEQVRGEEIESKQTTDTVKQKKEDMKKLQGELEKIKQRNQEEYQKDLNRKQSQLEKLQQELKELQNQADEGGLLKTEKQAIESEITSLQIEIEDLKGTSDEQLESELDTKESEIKALEQEIKDLNNGAETAPASNATYHQLISELGAERVQTNNKITELESQRNVSSANSNTLTITAHKDGYLHYLLPMKVGIGLQSFQPVAQVDSDEDSELIVESYISAQDISKVSVGDSVKVAIEGVNQTKFGMLKGEVIEISNGTITQQDENGASVMLYQVIIALKTKELNTDGEIIVAKAAMPVAANIVYESESYLEWLLEQLNFTK